VCLFCLKFIFRGLNSALLFFIRVALYDIVGEVSSFLLTLSRNFVG
jgi:hypothetical protein